MLNGTKTSQYTVGIKVHLVTFYPNPIPCLVLMFDWCGDLVGIFIFTGAVQASRFYYVLEI